jgi:hypothetical protein
MKYSLQYQKGEKDTHYKRANAGRLKLEEEKSVNGVLFKTTYRPTKNI